MIMPLTIILGNSRGCKISFHILWKKSFMSRVLWMFFSFPLLSIFQNKYCPASFLSHRGVMRACIYGARAHQNSLLSIKGRSS